MVFGMPRALFPALATTFFGGGAATLGFLYAAPGAGALIGALTTGWVSRIQRQGLAVILAAIGVASQVFDKTEPAGNRSSTRSGPPSARRPASRWGRSFRTPGDSGNGVVATVIGVVVLLFGALACSSSRSYRTVLITFGR